MAQGPIHLDCTRVSVVVKCRDCDFWSAFAFTKIEGWRRAAAHEALVHPERTQARDALSMALSRHAVATV